MSYLTDDCYEVSNPTVIFVLVVQTPCMFGCIGLTILFWYNYHYQQSDDLKSTRNVIKTSIAAKNTKDLDSKHIQKLGGITLILYSLFILIFFMSLTMDISMGCPDISIWIVPIGGVSYMGGFVGVITLFTYRIIIAFKNTKYEASSRLLTILKIISIFIMVSMASVFILRVANIVSASLGSGIMLFCVLLLFFYGLVLLRLFLIKLNYVINDFGIEFGNLPKEQLIKLTRSNSGSFDAKTSDFNLNVNVGAVGAVGPASADTGAADVTGAAVAGAQDGTNKPYVTRLINDISELKIKYTLMVIIALISSVFFLILAIISLHVQNKMNEYEHDSFRLKIKISTTILSIDSFVNCFCLFLQFDFSQNFYKKLCICCHNKCQDRYTKKANKQLIKSGHSNMKFRRTKSKDIVFESNNNSNNSNNSNNNNNNNDKKNKQVSKIDVVFDDQTNLAVKVNVGNKIINTLQA